MTALLSAATADTTGSSVELTAPTTVIAKGPFVGATAILQASADNSSFSDVGSISADGAVNVDIQGTYYLRGKLIDSKSGTSVTLTTTT